MADRRPPLLGHAIHPAIALLLMDEPGRRSAAKLLTRDEARRLAKLPELLPRPGGPQRRIARSCLIASQGEAGGSGEASCRSTAENASPPIRLLPIVAPARYLVAPPEQGGAIAILSNLTHKSAFVASVNV